MKPKLINRRELLSMATVSTIAGLVGGGALAAQALVKTRPGVPRPLRAFIASYMQAMNAPGLTLALANREGIVATAAFGYVDLASKDPVTELHRFEIGSITKSFAALVILQLQDEGKLDVQHPIMRYLPWLPIETDYGEIRIHHLLTHSSGMPEDVPVIPGEPDAHARQAFVPGSQFHYSNWGFEVLGRIVESIDGVSWPEALTRRLLAPLGMSDTAAAITNRDRSRIAQSYVPLQDDRPYPRHGALAVAPAVIFSAAAGSVASTPADMCRYLQFLLNRGIGPRGRLVSEDGYRLFSTPHIAAEEFGPGAGYGYGIAIDELDGHKRLRHTGGMLSFMSSLQIDLDAGVGAFASINAQLGYRPNPVTQYGIQLLRAAAEGKAAPSAPPADATAEVNAADGYAGIYRAADGRMLELRAADKRLVLIADGTLIPLQQVKDDHFIADHPQFCLYLLVFGRDAAKAVVELGIGPDWYANSRYAGVRSLGPALPLAPYPGIYLSDDSGRATRIVMCRAQLWVDGVTPLVPIGERLFRFADEPSSPETAEFRRIIDGQAQILIADGGVLRRIFEA